MLGLAALQFIEAALDLGYIIERASSGSSNRQEIVRRTCEESRHKSYVVRYSAFANYKRQRTVTYRKKLAVDGRLVSRAVKGTTRKVIEQDGCAGMYNSLLYQEKKRANGIQAFAQKLLRRA